MMLNVINKLKNFINQEGLLEVSKASGIGVDILIEDCGLGYKTFKDILFEPARYHNGSCSETYFNASSLLIRLLPLASLVKILIALFINAL